MKVTLPTKIVLRRPIFRLVAVLTFAVGVAIVWNWQPKSIQTRFLVQLPPAPRPLSELEAIPNVCGDLIIKLESDGSLRLNNEKSGNLDETNELSVGLRQIFNERVENAVFAEGFANRQDLPDEERIYKRVVVAAPSSAKYRDVLRVIDTVKTSRTDDIWLQIDGEDYTWLIFEAVKPSR